MFVCFCFLFFIVFGRRRMGWCRSNSKNFKLPNDGCEKGNKSLCNVKSNAYRTHRRINWSLLQGIWILLGYYCIPWQYNNINLWSFFWQQLINYWRIQRSVYSSWPSGPCALKVTQFAKEVWRLSWYGVIYATSLKIRAPENFNFEGSHIFN